jgi:predicted ATPase
VNSNDAIEANQAGQIAQIVTLVSVRGTPPGSDLTQTLLRLGAHTVDDSGSNHIAHFSSPSQALRATIEAVGQYSEHLAAGIATAEVLGDIGNLRLLEESQTLVAAADAGQVLVGLSFLELARGSADSTTEFIDLGNRSMPSSGGQLKAYAISDPRLPEVYRVAAARRPYLAHRFLGRRSEIDYLTELADRCRLISIVGGAGIGKTALAARFEQEVQDRFEDGSYWVDLTSVSRPYLLLHEIAKALDVPGHEEATLVERIGRLIGKRDVLLVLDGTVGLEDHVARFSEYLLHECPNVLILTTGLRRLDLKGEETYAIIGLELPLPYESLEAVRSYDSIQLFLREAATADPEFRLSMSNLGEVVGIATILEGSPEALVMAASRLSVLSITHLHARLRDDPLAELRLPPADGPVRGIERAFAMSLSVVSPWANDLFQKLCTFSGPFDFEAVEEVCSDANLPKSAMLAALRELCDIHLVRRWPRAGKNRAFFLPILAKEFAQRLLNQSGKSKEVSKRKERYLEARLPKVAEGVMVGKSEILDEFDVLYEDVRTSWKRLLQAGRSAEVCSSVVKLAGYWFQRGYLSEGLDTIAEILVSKGAEKSPDFVRVVNAGAWIAIQAGDYATAEKYCRISVRRCYERKDWPEMAKALNAAGGLALDLDRSRVAVRLLRRAADLSDVHVGGANRRAIHQNYAIALTRTGDYDGAEKVLEALTDAAAGGEWSDVSLFLTLADLKLNRAHLISCIELLLLVAPKLEATPDRRALGNFYSIGAWLALKLDRRTDAVTLVHAYAALLEHFDVRLNPRRLALHKLIVASLGCDPMGPHPWDPVSPTSLLVNFLQTWD